MNLNRAILFNMRAGFFLLSFYTHAIFSRSLGALFSSCLSPSLSRFLFRSIGRPIFLLSTWVENQRDVHCHRCSNQWRKKNSLGNQRWPQMFYQIHEKRFQTNRTRACLHIHLQWTNKPNKLCKLKRLKIQTKRNKTNCEKSAAATDKPIFERQKFPGLAWAKPLKVSTFHKLIWINVVCLKNTQPGEHRHTQHIIDIQKTGFNCSVAVAQNRVFKFKFMPRSVFF